MWLEWYFWLALALLFALAAFAALRCRPKLRFFRLAHAFGASVIVGAALIALSVAAYLSWWYRGRATALNQDLFPGIRYVRSIDRSPRPIVAHFLVIDLTRTNISFFVTTPDVAGNPSLKASTVETFLRTSGVDLAINANFFQPFHSNTPWDYYPHAGDPVQVLGLAAASGQQYSTHVWANATLHISSSNTAQLGGTPRELWNAISGDQWLIQDGRVVATNDGFGPYPRAAAALNEEGTSLILAAVDGKQPGFSEGVTLPELAELLTKHGGYNAINLDGGGSVTLVAAGTKGRPTVLNSPIHTRIPGRQRPVANHLGIRGR